MDIVEFFQSNAGKWFIHRTSQHLTTNQSDGNKSNLLIEWLEPENLEVTQLCEQAAIAPTSALCGLRIAYLDPAASSQPKRWGTKAAPAPTILVAIPDGSDVTQGRLLRSGQTATGTIRYHFGRDEALTLITQYDAVETEERLWFASPNLRLRTTLVKQPNGFSLVSFASEIRMDVPPPPPQPVETASQA